MRSYAFDEITTYWAPNFGDYWRVTDRMGETRSSSGHYIRQQAFLGTSSVSVEKLVELKGTYCSEVVSGVRCGKAYQYSARHVGAQVDLEWKCANGQCGKWESQ